MKDVDMIIQGGKILSFDDTLPFIENGYVAISGDSIEAVEDMQNLEFRYVSNNIIDATNCIVMPGLINCHTHAAMTCFRGIADDLKLEDWLNNYIFPAEAKNVSPELAYWGSLLACAEMIRSGTTTFCDMYIFEDETAKAAHESGMRCLIGEVLFDFPSPSSPTPKDGLDYTKKLIEKWDHDPLINIAVEPHSLYTCSTELLKTANGLSRQYDVPIATHLLETEFERDQLHDKFGKSATEFLDEIGCLTNRLIAFHCVSMDMDDIARFANAGCSVVHNPESNMKLASGVAPVPDMLAAGLSVALGTDGCASNNNLDLFQEMDMAAKLHKVHRLDPTVMDAETVCRMATIEGAKTLRMEDRVGSLRPGKKADIIIIDMDQPHLIPLYNEYSHLAYSVGGGDVQTVIINGAVVMKDRKLLTIKEDNVMKRVVDISKRIARSLEDN